jgi:hypothetical protein
VVNRRPTKCRSAIDKESRMVPECDSDQQHMQVLYHPFSRFSPSTRVYAVKA